MSQSEDNSRNNEENNRDLPREENLNEEGTAQQTEGEPLQDEASIEDLRAEVARLQEKADENWNTVLRMKAEAENQRKRSEKQVEDAHKYAVKKFVEELLPVADSLEMGMNAEGDVEKIREGMGLTMKVLENALEKFKVEQVNPLGEKFDPELHQAMATQPSDEYDDGQVSAVMQKGYTLNGRLVRPAMVMVAKNK